VNEEAPVPMKAFLAGGKVVAAVCHGLRLPVQARCLEETQATSFKSI
jgi:putative intracellular protease/amidase